MRFIMVLGGRVVGLVVARQRVEAFAHITPFTDDVRNFGAAGANYASCQVSNVNPFHASYL